MSDSTSGVDLAAEAELAQLRLELAKAQADAAAARLKAAEAEIARKAAERNKSAQTKTVPAPAISPGESNGHSGAEKNGSQSPKTHRASPAAPPAPATRPAPVKPVKPVEPAKAEKQAVNKTQPTKSTSGPLADEATAETLISSPHPNSNTSARPAPAAPAVAPPPAARSAGPPVLPKTAIAPSSVVVESPPSPPPAEPAITTSPNPAKSEATKPEATKPEKTTPDAVKPAAAETTVSQAPVTRGKSQAPRPTPKSAAARGNSPSDPPKLPAIVAAAAQSPAVSASEAANLPAAASRETSAAAGLIDDEVNLPGYRSLTRMIGSSLLSAVIHVAFLIALGLWYADVIVKEQPEIVSVPIPVQDTVTEVLDTRITPSDADVASATTVEAAAAGVASPLAVSTETKLDQEAVENAEPVYFTPGELAQIAGMGGTEAIKEITKEFKGDPSAVVDSIDEALDRLTHEILLMLQKGDVVVVWLFDESESMKDDRKEIRDRINRVYAELGLKEEAKAGHLAGAVCSFGSKWHVHNQVPTTDTDALMKAIGGVVDDDSGNEMLCQSVQTSIEFYKEYARKTRRQMAVVLVTDESGDPNTNQTHLELAIQSAKDARARVYGIGREAVFGYPYAYMAWTDPSTQITYWLQIDRGPETPGVEALQTNGLWRRWDAHPSGFGPYEQTRMCRETGGIFFMLPSPETLLVGRDDRKYELAKMRPYLPSLERRDVYDNELAKSRLRSTVKKVIYDLNPWKIPQIDLRQDFTIEGPALRDEIVQELGKIKQYVLYLDAAEQAMKAAETERQNAEVYPRWQANYDLIYAQILAYKVRLYQYGAFLQSFLEKPRPPALRPPANVLATATSTNWQIITLERLLPTNYWPIEEQEKYIAEATRRFEAIMKDHEGTPWAARAQWELSRGFGVDFVQEWDDPRRGQGVKLPKY